jgi:N-lysine methyltransferase SETD6
LRHPGEDGPSIPDELLALVYLLLADDESLAAISQSSLPSRSNLATELVGQVLIDLLNFREAEYATTAEEDEQLLHKEQLPIRKLFAIQVRLGEKYVLRAAIQEAKTFHGSNKRMRGLSTEPEGLNNKRKAASVMSGNKKRRPNWGWNSSRENGTSRRTSSKIITNQILFFSGLLNFEH